jgi:hypothetical protein
LEISSAVPAAVAGKALRLTYIKIVADTVWLSIWVAYFTFIFVNPVKFMWLSLSLGQHLIGKDFSLSYIDVIWSQHATLFPK